MKFSVIPWDLAAILLLLAVVVPWRGAVRVRKLLAAPELSSRARITIYSSTIIFQWLLCALTAWRCVARAWSYESLGLALATPTSTIGIGLALAAALALMQLAAFRQLGRMPPDRRGRLAGIASKLMPQSLVEAFPFVALVCTVSICEEFLYRGFAYSAIQRISGGSAFAAMIGSSLLFGIGHVYQGRRGVVNTSVLGAIFAGARLWTGSLAPAILAHLAVDLVAGLGGSRLALSSQDDSQGPAVAASDSTPT